MVRPEQRLHPARDVAAPRAAAGIVLLRPLAGRAGFELLLTRRGSAASFAPDAYVFPGGAVDAADRAPHDTVPARPGHDAEDLAHALAALRELHEEMGILLASDADGTAVTAAQARTIARDDSAAFYRSVQSAGLRLATGALRWLCQWTTPLDNPKRFDARFFIARAPAGQTAQPDGIEQFDAVWITPHEALQRMQWGSFPMMFPTMRTLERLAAYADVDALFAALDGHEPLWASRPRAAMRGGKPVRIEPHETAYGELELVAPDGQVQPVLDWRSDAVVPLMRNVHRLTAPNAGRMTGPGTNCWIVGTAADGYVVIDPGPDDAAHVERIRQFVQDRLVAIICTHSHLDHAPGAWLLGRATGVPVRGLPSAPTARESARFTPDIEVADGERFTVGSTTLRVVTTPGHAANHLCLFAEEDRLLFSGDHILNGTTTVIDPPDGDLAEFMHSLDRLEALQASYVMPAHGYVLADPAGNIRRLRRHRLMRERRVTDALAASGGGTLAQLVAAVYDDTPVDLHPVATRSLLAHLLKLAHDGRARQHEDRWEPVAAAAGTPADAAARPGMPAG